MRWSLVMLGVIAWQAPKIIKAHRFLAGLASPRLAPVIELFPPTEDDVA